MPEKENLYKKSLIGGLTVAEFTVLYDVSYHTWRSWLVPFEKKIGKRNGNSYTPKQCKKIYEYLGEPDFV